MGTVEQLAAQIRAQNDMAAQPTMGKENVQTATKQEPPALAALDLTGATPPPLPVPPPAATPSKPPAPLLTPRSAPPPPPPPAPIACPRIEAKDFETLAARRSRPPTSSRAASTSSWRRARRSRGP